MCQSHNAHTLHVFLFTNMKSLRLTFPIVLLAVMPISAVATDPQSQSISTAINASGVIVVDHPAALEVRLKSEESPKADSDTTESVESEAEKKESVDTHASTSKKIGGYRVQVFSDNNPRTAKNEARAKAKEIGQAFPQYRAYVVFTAPYWRLRVGDFKTQEEAQNAATAIKKHFPTLSKEIRVVRDRINIK